MFAELRSADETFSPFLPDSAVNRIKAGTLSERDAAPVVREVLDLCRMYEVTTHGYFSASRSGVLDPCGLVKGWAIDRACAILERAGQAYAIDAELRATSTSGYEELIAA